jgi:hypothetical protein
MKSAELRSFRFLALAFLLSILFDAGGGSV